MHALEENTMTNYLGCKHCPALTKVSAEDPDSSLSDAVNHQTARHGTRDWTIAMRSIKEVTRADV
jgi:hypothetical protein